MAPAVRVLLALRDAHARSGTFLVAAAIGTGMAAQAAARGGADFLVALNAGHLRSMGEPSVASLLALRDTNRFVMGFAKAEIRPRTQLPIFLGLAAFDPRLDMDAVLGEAREAGFEGVTNFPTVALIDGHFRRFLESSGLGFAREVALLQRARAHGLATLAYVHAAHEARQMAAVGVDIINVDLGWNTGGALGVATRMPIPEAAEVAGRMIRAIRKISGSTVCLVEGGPIVRPEEMDEVCRAARSDGYIGGSTIDRVPLEAAIEMATSAFKTIGALRRRVSRLERRLYPRHTPVCLVGTAPPVIAAGAAYEHAVASDLPVLILGEPGSGRRDLARALHTSSGRRARRLTWLTCAGGQDRIDADLFGCEPGAAPGVVRRRIGWLEVASGSTLVLDDLGELDPATQRRLRAAVESGGFRRVGGAEHLPLDVRLVGISKLDPARQSERFDPRLLDLFGVFRIELTPLREHLEDLPQIIEHMLETLTADKLAAIDPRSYRLLLNHDWPGNVRELGNVLRQAQVAAGGAMILPSHLPPLKAQQPRDQRAGFASEREWILDGLRRNRFRRAETARFLGVSRKTLYNKMVALGLLVSPAGPQTG